MGVVTGRFLPRVRGKLSFTVAALCAALLFGAVFSAGALATGRPALSAYKNQIVVTPAKGASAAVLDSVLRLQGLTKVTASTYTGDVLVQAPFWVDPLAEAAKLSAQPCIEKAEPNWAAKATSAPNDPLYSKQYAMAKVDAASAWSQSNASGVTLAVVDTGVQSTHPDLAGRVLPGWDFMNGDSIAEDDQGHGTHVAGIAAATANNAIGIAGVAPGCSILPVKVLDSDGSGGWYQISEGVYYATARGAQVINMSIGGPYSDIMGPAVAYARSHGVVVVVAAGNDASNYPSYPAAYPGVISVAATTDRDVAASFSNFGPAVDIAAPGDSILSTTRNGAYGYMSGTSMAAPAVAGAAAVLSARYPAFTPAQIENALEAGATDLGTPGRDDIYGNGRLSVSGALAAAASASSSGSGSIEGTVRGSSVGLGSVQVTAYRVTGGVFEIAASTLSAADGTYRLANLDSGTYALGFRDTLGSWASAYYSTDGPQREQSSATRVAVTDGTTATGIDLELAGAGTIGGTVRTSAGVAVPGARVELGYTGGYGDFKTVAATLADGLGVYEFDGVSAGYYSVRASDPAGDLLAALHCDADGVVTPAEALAGSVTGSVDVTMAPGAVVTGKVTTAAGVPLAGMMVRVQGYLQQSWAPCDVRVVRTSAGGVYAAAGLPTGDYDVTVTDPNGAYETSSAPKAVSAKQGVTSTLDDMKLRGASHITGRVKTAAAAGVGGIAIESYWQDAAGNYMEGPTAFTAADGSYDLGGLSAAVVDVRYYDYSGTYSIESTLVVVGAGETRSGIDALAKTSKFIRGTVVDEFGDPIQGAKVMAEPWEDIAVFSAADGSFSLPANYSGDAFDVSILRVMDPEGRYIDRYYSFDRMLYPLSADVTGVQISMWSGGQLGGVVRDLSGMPRANVEVTVEAVDGGWMNSQVSVTDADGRYSVSGLDYNLYNVNARDLAGSLEGTVTTYQVTDITAPGTLDLTMTGMGTISGRVLDDQGRPRSLATVHYGIRDADGNPIDLGWADTDELGRYTLKGISAGDYIVWYGDDTSLYDDQYWNGTASSKSATPVTVVAGDAVNDVDFHLIARGGISGTVTDDSAAPLAGISINIGYNDPMYGFSTVMSTATDANGRYLAHVPDGDWIVEASDPTGAHQTGYFDGVTAPELGTLVSVSGPAITGGKDLSLPKRASISGTVRDGAGAPLRWVSVDVYDSMNNCVGWAETAGDGSYTAYVDGPATFRVGFSGVNIGYGDAYYDAQSTLAAAAPVDVLASDSAVTGIDGVLTAMPVIQGVVHLSDGSPACTEVEVVDATTGSFVDSTWTDYETGAYSFTVPAGDYKVHALSSDGSQVPRFAPSAAAFADGATISVTDGELRTGVDVTLGLAGSISGKASASGFPAGDVTVDLYTAAGDFVVSTQTMSDGTYYIDALEAGSYVVNFRDTAARFDSQYYDGQATPDVATPVTVVAGAETRNIDGNLIDASANVVYGTVVDGKGSPIPGIQIQAGLGDSIQVYSGPTTVTDASGAFRLVLDPAATDCSVQLMEPVASTIFMYDSGNPVALPLSTGLDIVWAAGGVDTVAPVTTASDVPAGWSKDPITVSLSATDDVSGVSDTWLSVNGRPETSYVSPMKFTVEGTTTLTYYSVDYAGNAETPAELKLRIDRTPPATTDDALASYDSGGGSTVALSATDSLSGVAQTYWRIGSSGAFTAGSAATVPTAEGSYTLEYYSVDNAGNAEKVSTVGFDVVLALDHKAPVTTADALPSSALTRWVSSDVTLTLSAVDTASGVAWTRYSVSGADALDYTGTPIVITTEGTTPVAFRSQDTSGNAETTTTVYVRIDRTAPVTGISAIPSSYVAGVGGSIMLLPTDGGAGVSATYWRLNGGAWAIGTSVAVPAAPGSYTLEYYAVDGAGNAEAIKSATFTVVAPAPIAVMLGTPKLSGKATTKGAKLSGTVAPAHAGSARVEVQVLVKRKYKAYRKYPVVLTPAGTWAYKAKLKRGTYKVRLITAADGTYLAGASGWRKVVVK